MPPPGSGGSPSADGPSFTYSGVDPDMARHLFESLFGGAGSFTFSSMPGANMAGAGGPGGGSFQFMSSGPGGTAFASSGPGGNRGGPFNIHTSSGTGAGNNRRRWASAFGGNDSDEDMFTAGTPGADPFAAFNQGPNGFFQQQQQQRQRPGSGGGWSGSSGQWGGSSAGGSPLSGFAGQQQQQPSPQLVSLPLSLEELYKGCTKRLKVSHMRLCTIASCLS